MSGEAATRVVLVHPGDDLCAMLAGDDGLVVSVVRVDGPALAPEWLSYAAPSGASAEWAAAVAEGPEAAATSIVLWDARQAPPLPPALIAQRPDLGWIVLHETAATADAATEAMVRAAAADGGNVPLVLPIDARTLATKGLLRLLLDQVARLQQRQRSQRRRQFEQSVELHERIEQRAAVLGATVRELRQEIGRRGEMEKALHREKERLRTVVETLPHGIVEIAVDGTIEFANASLRSMLDREAGPLVGRSLWALVRPVEAAERLRTKVEQFVAQQPSPSEEFERVLGQDDRWLELRVNWDYRRDARQNINGFVAAVTDITQQRHAEAVAQRRLEELAQVSSLVTMGEVVARLAHELNQPLATVANYAYLGRHYVRELQGAAAAPLAESLQHIVEQATRAGEIIRRLRAFSRRADAQPQSTDLHQLAVEVAALAADEVRSKGIELRLERSGPLPAVAVDRVQIQQVIANLVRNAVEAVAEYPPARRTIVVRTARDGADRVRLEVIDSGGGLTGEVAARLFEPFFTTKPKGLGLGLAVARSIVETHRGRLDALNNDRGGATFSLRLPMAGAGFAKPSVDRNGAAAAGAWASMPVVPHEGESEAIVTELTASDGRALQSAAAPASAPPLEGNQAIAKPRRARAARSAGQPRPPEG